MIFLSRMRNKLPCLYTLALKYLSIPASSGPVERVFSRLTPKNLERTTLLYTNIENLNLK